MWVGGGRSDRCTLCQTAFWHGVQQRLGRRRSPMMRSGCRPRRWMRISLSGETIEQCGIAERGSVGITRLSPTSRVVDGVEPAETAACPADAANVAVLGEDVGRWPTDKRVAALAMVVHCADLGNPGKPLPFSLNWCAATTHRNPDHARSPENAPGAGAGFLLASWQACTAAAEAKSLFRDTCSGTSRSPGHTGVVPRQAVRPDADSARAAASSLHGQRSRGMPCEMMCCQRLHSGLQVRTDLPGVLRAGRCGARRGAPRQPRLRSRRH